MPTIAEVRKNYPQYNDISDRELADRLHARFYADLPKEDFYKRVGVATAEPDDPNPFTGLGQNIGGSLVSGFGQTLKGISGLYGLASGDFDTSLSRLGERAVETGKRIKPDDQIAREEAAAARVREAGAGGGWQGFTREASQELVEATRSPSSILAAAIEAAPSMAGTIGVGAVAKKAVTSVAERRAASEAARQAALRAGQRAGVAGAVGTGAGLQGADVGEETYRRALGLPDDVWAADDGFRELVASGMSPDTAKNVRALQQARQAATVAAAVSAGTATVLPGVERTVLGRAPSGKILPRVGRGTLAEAAQEGIEEGAGALAGNVAVAGIDPETALLEGVGSAGVKGAIVGGILGGGTSALMPGRVESEAEAEMTPVSEPEPVVDAPVEVPIEAASVPAPVVDVPEPVVAASEPAVAVPEPKAIDTPAAAPPLRRVEINANPDPTAEPVVETLDVIREDAEAGIVNVRRPDGVEETVPQSFIAERLIREVPIEERAPAAIPSERIVAPEPPAAAPPSPPVEPPSEPPVAAPPPAPPPQSVDIQLGKERFWTGKLPRLISNRMNRLGFTEQQIEQVTGSAIPRAQRPSEMAALFEGRVTPRLDEITRDNFNPIVDEMKARGLTANEVDLYLWARAAPARNAKIAERNPEMPDGGSGMTNEAAAEYMALFEAEGTLPALEAVAQKVDALTQRTRDTMVEYDMITSAQADGLAATEPMYVPLKGRAEDGDTSTPSEEDAVGNFGGSGYTITPREYRPAKGRSSTPLSPLANAMADAQAAVIRGETNRYRQTFLNEIVRKYPSKYWQAFTEDNPDVTRGLDGRTGTVVQRPVDMAGRPKEYLVVKEGGKPVYIKINDPLLMRAMQNASAKDWSALNRALGSTIGAVTRALSRLYTTLNPEFVVTNFSRDIQAAVFNMLAEQGRADGRIAGKQIVDDVIADVANWRQWRSLFRATFSHEAGTEEQRQMSELFFQAKEDGAFTGWVQRENAEEHIKDIQRLLNDASAVGAEAARAKTRQGVSKVIQVVEDLNSVFENSIRLSVYKNALKVGLTRDEAANMARNVTVDFNRKGELGPTIGALYAFFNAAVQGNVQLLRSLTNVKGGKVTLAQKAALGLVGLGFVRSLYNSMMSGDGEDDEPHYEKVPDYVKQRNMVFMNPLDRRTYASIPLPYGYSFFDNIGSGLADVITGTMSPTDYGVYLVNGILNNFSPIPVNIASYEGALGSFVPTVFKPIYDIAVNTNYFGSRIYNEPIQQGDAESSMARISTPEVYKAITKWMNEATGGTGKIAGGVDVAPEKLQYAVEQYIGGIGNMIFGSIDAAGKAATGRDVEIREIPFVRKLVGEPTKGADLGAYYERIAEVGPVDRQLRAVETDADRADIVKKFPVESDAAVITAMKAARSASKKITAEKREVSESDMPWGAKQRKIDELNEQQRRAFIQFNKVYNAAEKRLKP